MKTSHLALLGVLLLTGCTTPLPYSVAIGDPVGGGHPDHQTCTLRLDNLAANAAEAFRASASTLRNLQRRLEITLNEQTHTLTHCQDEDGHAIPAKKIPAIEEVASKWLTAYALDATDPDQDIDRLREYLRSAQLVQHLAQRSLLPDEDPAHTYNVIEQPTMRQSQWCGPLEAAACAKARSLYRVVTTPTTLYEDLLKELSPIQEQGTERMRRYFVLGYEFPWDGDKTLVRYGLTFYFRQVGHEPAASGPAGESPVELIGYDLAYANEATPQPLLRTAGTKAPSAASPLPWADNPWRITGYPFSLVIGLKNAAFELAKLPFSTIAGLAFGRDRVNYPLENLVTAYHAFYVEATTQTRGGAEWGLYRLLLETPLIGQLFQYNFSYDRSEPDEAADNSAIPRKLFLSRGIYGGNKWGQDTGLWALFAKQSYPDYDVYSPPYRHGTVIDVVWSMFNLSHGPAYSEARYIMEQASRDDRLYLAGHSGGVQRSAAASQILTHHKYRVMKVVGLAGPNIGQALVDPRFPQPFTIYLNTGTGANQDIVSKVGVVAGGVATLLDYAVLVPLKYTVGNLVFWNRDEVYGAFDRIGFFNATIVEVARKPSSLHQTPLRQSFTNRLIYDAYVRNEFATAFREDLERPDSPQGVEREHAVPWGR